MTRINAWKLKDTPQDLCAVKCSYTALKFLEPNGDIKLEEMKKNLPELDVTPMKERNINSPTIMSSSVIAFINTNRALLVKAFGHEEAAAAWIWLNLILNDNSKF